MTLFLIAPFAVAALIVALCVFRVSVAGPRTYDGGIGQPADNRRHQRPDQHRLATPCICGARRFCGAGCVRSSHGEPNA